MDYVDIIKKYIKDSVSIEEVSHTSNIVFKVVRENGEVLYAKFYLNNSSHIDHEMNLYKLVDNKYLKEVVCTSISPKMAIFKELKGTTIDELSISDKAKYSDLIIDSLYEFFESIASIKVNGYGLLDENMEGTSDSFIEFLNSRQKGTALNLKDYPFLSNLFDLICTKYKDIITSDNSLIPIDTNMKNIMLTDKEEIKFIDPGELISAPKLMGYGDFVAHTYKTILYDKLIKKLNLTKDEEKLLRIYAIFSSLNILSFLHNLGVDNLKEVIPFGNTYTFYELIEEHAKYLELNK